MLKEGGCLRLAAGHSRKGLRAFGANSNTPLRPLGLLGPEDDIKDVRKNSSLKVWAFKLISGFERFHEHPAVRA